MKILITGGAGFIGSHLVDRLIGDHELIVIDNFSLGQRDFLSSHLNNPRLILVEGDLLNSALLKKWMQGVDLVFHLAANSDIREGIRSTETDLKLGILTTYNVLEAVRQSGVKKIVFASSSVVYGMAKKIPTPEDYGPLVPISLYGASKLASEGLLTAFSHTFDIQSWIFRFANVVGPRMTHGVLVDFWEKLSRDRKRLEILGDGRQRKSYLYVSDCIEGMLFGLEHARDLVNLYNLSTDDRIRVTTIAEILARKVGLEKIRFEFTGTSCGWKGDVPQMGLDPSKMKELGWKPRLNSRQAIEKAIEELLACRPLSLQGV